MGQASYNLDPLLWAKEQALALRERRFNDLDIEHLTEEVEDLGGSDRDALESCIIIVMAHLLKWQYQPSALSGSWKGSIVEHRLRIEKMLKRIPSLKQTVEGMTVGGYEDALKIAMAGTKFDRFLFPETCPYDFQKIMEIEIVLPLLPPKKKRKTKKRRTG